MSTTIAHRSHVHHRVPWLSVAVVIVAIAVAAVVIYAVNQPTTTTTGTVAEPAVQPAAPAMSIPEPDSYAFMRKMMMANKLGGAEKAGFRVERHNFVEGRWNP